MTTSENTPSIPGSLLDRCHEKRKVFYLGLILYVISFFLPSLWNGDEYVTGWRCAFVAMGVWATNGWVNAGYRLGVRLTIFGGLINVLVIAYAVLWFFRCSHRARLTIALAILACLPPMWVSLYLLDARPYVGHAAWIAGLLLLVFGDIRGSLPTLRRARAS